MSETGTGAKTETTEEKKENSFYSYPENRALLFAAVQQIVGEVSSALNEHRSIFTSRRATEDARTIGELVRARNGLTKSRDEGPGLVEVVQAIDKAILAIADSFVPPSVEEPLKEPEVEGGEG